MPEVWKDIPGWEGKYQVSDCGNIRSLTRLVRDKRGGVRTLKGKVLKLNLSGNHGYPTICLKFQNRVERALVHRLIMLAFVGPCPDGMEVAHYDGNRKNPRLDNLRYATRASNHSDKKRHGTQLRGEKVPTATLTDEQALEIIENRELITQSELADRYGVDFRVISNIQLGRTWKHVKGNRRPHTKRVARGERGGSAKLSEAQVRKILGLRGTDTTKNIAKRFGVSVSLIGAIYAGRVWAHLDRKEIG